jgi:hypothetical protein
MTETENHNRILLNQDDQLHQRRLRTMQAAYFKTETFTDIEKAYALAPHTIVQDWARRATWLPKFLQLNDAAALQADIIGRWTSYCDLSMNMAQLYRLDNKHASNEALKNYREGLDHLGNLLQSMGILPKVAQEIKLDESHTDKTIDTTDWTQQERETLTKAAQFLNKAEQNRNSRSTLH